MSSTVIFILFVLNSFASSQTTRLTIEAGAAVYDGSYASAYGTGYGTDVSGEAVVQITDDVSSSAIVMSATGSDSSDKPQPPPSKSTKPPAKKVHAPPSKRHEVHPTPSYKKIYEPQCEYAKCNEIELYDYCGFCNDTKNGIQQACSYKREFVVKTGKKEEYEIVPLCKCEGEFILKAEDCPACSKALCHNIDNFEQCGYCTNDIYYPCSYTIEKVVVPGKTDTTEYTIVPDCTCDGTFIIESNKCPAYYYYTAHPASSKKVVAKYPEPAHPHHSSKKVVVEHHEPAYYHHTSKKVAVEPASKKVSKVDQDKKQLDSFVTSQASVATIVFGDDDDDDDADSESSN